MQYSAANVIFGIGDTNTTGAEQRRHPRTRLKRPVVLQLPSGEVIRGRTVEMSMGGIGLMLPKPLATGQSCVLSFSVFHNNSNLIVTGVGKVAHCACSHLDGFRVGMQFTFSDERIQRAVAELLRLPFPA